MKNSLSYIPLSSFEIHLGFLSIYIASKANVNRREVVRNEDSDYWFAIRVLWTKNHEAFSTERSAGTETLELSNFSRVNSW